jgi:gamma-glutamyltranspeptidase/glutathione hydrolase
MISGPSPYAVKVGEGIAEKGGNVVDVAVAVGLALAVTSPYYAAFGGGGFALIKMGESPVEVLDFREMAPAATHPKVYLDKDEEASKTGGLAVGVPGVPAGLWEMHKKFGKLHWSQLFREPIRLAQKGFRVSGEWWEKTNKNKSRFDKGGIKHFFKNREELISPGEKFRQPALTRVLREMRNRNIVPFYQGGVARDIVQSVKSNGGVITLKDMKDYKVRWLKPLERDFLGYKVHLMPPPSSGGVVIASALDLVERLKLKELKPLSGNEFHMLGEILSRSFRGRALLGDPDFHKNPMEKLLSDAYLKKMAQSIDPKKATTLTPLSEDSPEESSETTHFSVLDKEGNAVALTVTLNGSYGSAVVSEKYGIALNNEMDDFTTRPNKPNMYGLIQGKGNYVQPGKRPLSSMSPTLIEKDGKIVLAIGAPGGPRIISGVFQGIYRLLVTGMNIDRAIQSPRVHHQFLPNTLFIEKWRFSPEIVADLKQRGHSVEESWQSRVYGVRYQNGRIKAAFDNRGEGATAGY